MRAQTVTTLIAFALLAAFLGAGCGRRPSENARAYEIERSVTAPDAPLTVTVRVDRREISIADSFRCVIELTHDTGLEVKLPEFATLQKSFAPLVARDRRSLPPRVADGRIVKGDEYELEPLVSGGTTIAPIVIPYRVGVGETERTLETEPIELSVTSLGADDPRAQLRDVAGPVELPRARASSWLWAGVAAALVLAAAIAVIILARRRQRGAAVVERHRAPHEIAFDALRALREKDYIGRGLVTAFYIELSAILRWYIEQRFGLHAPEQTTEEFLADIARDGVFDLPRRTLLKSFLEHCDLVKFATYGPTPDEIQGAFTAAATFVDETKEEVTRGGV
jgi:hypothetical protein